MGQDRAMSLQIRQRDLDWFLLIIEKFQTEGLRDNSMAITTQTITDNSHILEMIIIGSAASDSFTINVSDLEDAIAIDGTHKQRLNINLEYSLHPLCSLKLEFATESSGSFSGIETGLSMDINGTAPITTIDSTAEGYLNLQVLA